MDFASLIQGKNLMLVGAIVAVTSSVKSFFPSFFNTHWGERLLPLLPVIIGVGAGIGGLVEAATFGDRVVAGLVVGFSAAQMFKIGKTTVMAYGVTPKLPAPQDPPTPPAQ